jgi:hypothetical protein
VPQLELRPFGRLHPKARRVFVEDLDQVALGRLEELDDR